MRLVHLKDKVIRSDFPCWVETTCRQLIDVSRYPRIGIEIIEDDERPWAVVVYKGIFDDDEYLVVGQYSKEEDARVFFNALVTKLQYQYKR